MVLSHELPPGTVLSRVSSDALGASEGSRSLTPTRFGPLRAGRDTVPLLYCGQDLRCALAETVFRDLVDDPDQPRNVSAFRVRSLRWSTLRTKEPTRLADFRDPALSSYGLTHADLMTDDYTSTAALAQDIWDSTDLHGLVWNSRRAPHRLSYLLFVADPPPRHRYHARMVRRRSLDPGTPVPLYTEPGYGHLLEAATEHNVTITT